MSKVPRIRTLTATRSASLTAMLGAPRPLYYEGGADDAAGLPAHVRAASAIRRRGTRLVIVQDDVNAIAVLDPSTHAARPLLLPADRSGLRVFDKVHGNKKRKLDLEACITLPDGRLVALGSGSSPLRERLVVIAADAIGSVRIVAGGELYARLRVHADARDAELNIEGAVVHGNSVRLLQRGNGKHGSKPWNAILDLALEGFVHWLDKPHGRLAIQRILDVELGAVEGVPVGFSDATVTADGRMAFLACAENSADVLSDGPVLSCRFGWLDHGDGAAVMTDVLDADGRPTSLKLEGIEASADGSPTFDVVADMDRPEEPAQIATLTVQG
jgi:hypothetical protein